MNHLMKRKELFTSHFGSPFSDFKDHPLYVRGGEQQFSVGVRGRAKPPPSWKGSKGQPERGGVSFITPQGPKDLPLDPPHF